MDERLGRTSHDLDDQGFVIWDKVRSAHYCGAPYGGRFVTAYETVEVGIPYEGPEVAEFLARERVTLKEP